jgi:hypothetical protein
MGIASSSSSTSAAKAGHGAGTGTGTSSDSFVSKRTQVTRQERAATVAAICDTAVANVHGMMRALPSMAPAPTSAPAPSMAPAPAAAPASTAPASTAITLASSGNAGGVAAHTHAHTSSKTPDTPMFQAFLARCTECASRGGSPLIKDELVHLTLIVSAFQANGFH